MVQIDKPNCGQSDLAQVGAQAAQLGGGVAVLDSVRVFDKAWA